MACVVSENIFQSVSVRIRIYLKNIPDTHIYYNIRRVNCNYCLLIVYKKCEKQECSQSSECQIQMKCGTANTCECPSNMSYSYTKTSCKYCKSGYYFSEPDDRCIACDENSSAGIYSHGNRCFQIIQIKKSWSNAQDHCKSMNASLIAINDQSDLDLITSIVKEQPSEYLGPFWVNIKRRVMNVKSLTYCFRIKRICFNL